MLYPAKRVTMLIPTSTASNATSTGQVDCAGFDWAIIDFEFPGGTTTNTVVACKLEEGDVATSVAAIAALTAGDGFTAPAPTTAGVQWVQRFNLDLKKRKRYLKASITPGTTLNCQVTANLFKGDTLPVGATATGVAGVVSL